MVVVQNFENRNLVLQNTCSKSKFKLRWCLRYRLRQPNELPATNKPMIAAMTPEGYRIQKRMDVCGYPHNRISSGIKNETSNGFANYQSSRANKKNQTENDVSR